MAMIWKRLEMRCKPSQIRSAQISGKHWLQQTHYQNNLVFLQMRHCSWLRMVFCPEPMRTGNFLDTLKEYPAYFKEAGISADQFVAIVAQTNKMGIFSDKGVDAIRGGKFAFAWNDDGDGGGFGRYRYFVGTSSKRFADRNQNNVRCYTRRFRKIGRIAG